MDLFFDSEFRRLIPPLQPAEYEQLTKSLTEEGNRDPIVIWKETKLLLDGHNRYDICHKLGLELKAPLEISFPNREAAKTWIINNQLGRRNLSPYQRSVLALQLEDIFKAQAKKNQGARVDITSCRNLQNVDTRAELAKIAKVSDNTIAKVKRIKESAPEFIKAGASRGDLSVHEAYIQTRALETLHEDDRPKAVNLVETGQAKNIFIARKLIQRDKARNTIPPTGKYQVIYADPPWEYDFGFDIHGAAERHYGTMALEDLCQFPPIKEIADDNAVLFLWATSPKLREALAVIDAWGFDYKTSFVWDKVKRGIGYYNSPRHEFLLIAIKGSYPRQSDDLPDSVVTIPRTDNHSQKPEEFRTIIEKMYPSANKIELFARYPSPKENWTFWGAEL